MTNSNLSEIFFGNNLRFLRKLKNITLVELSNATNISKSALSDYENGKNTPGIDVISIISTYFDIAIELLIYSDISEYFDKNKNFNLSRLKQVAKNPEDLTLFENEKYSFSVKLLNQKLASTELQNKMLAQLLDSKEAENKTLKINIKLLEEKLKNYS